MPATNPDRHSGATLRAIILAGGMGTRLRPFTLVLPKPLVPVGERPILQLILSQLARDGYRTVDLCVGHLGGLIQTYFADSQNVPNGMRLTYHREEEPLGTAGALRGVGELDEPFLVMNGDILTDLDFAELMTFHRASDAALSIATCSKTHQVAVGVIEQEGGKVRNYIEKPTMQYEVSMGVYVYSPRVLEHIPPGYFDFPDVVKVLLAAGERVVTYPFSGTWFDIGTPGDYDAALIRMQEEGATFLGDLTPTAVYPQQRPAQMFE